jgi:hypothetical protein
LFTLLYCCILSLEAQAGAQPLSPLEANTHSESLSSEEDSCGLYLD